MVGGLVRMDVQNEERVFLSDKNGFSFGVSFLFTHV